MYYKVVTKDLKSIQTHRSVAGVQYTVGSWVHAHPWLLARGYGLCVFDDLDEAKWCRETTGFNSQLFECKIKGALDFLPERALSAHHTNPLDQHIKPISTEEEWLHFLEVHPLHGPWPRGTVMVKSVKLGASYP